MRVTATLALMVIALSACVADTMPTPPATPTIAPTPTRIIPTPTSLPPTVQSLSPLLGPSARVESLADFQLKGWVALRPTGLGDYLLTRSPVWADAYYRLHATAWALARGTCLDYAPLVPGSYGQVPSDHLLTNWNHQDWQSRVRLDALKMPAVFLLTEVRDIGGLLACADLPLAELERREPLDRSVPNVTAIQSAVGWHITGRLLRWPTPGSEVLLRAEMEGPTNELTRSDGSVNLLWFLLEGPCAPLFADNSDWTSTHPILYKFTPLADSPKQQSFSLVLLTDFWAKGLSLAVFVDGGGPFVACGDLPPVQ